MKYTWQNFDSFLSVLMPNFSYFYSSLKVDQEPQNKVMNNSCVCRGSANDCDSSSLKGGD